MNSKLHLLVGLFISHTIVKEIHIDFLYNKSDDRCLCVNRSIERERSLGDKLDCCWGFSSFSLSMWTCFGQYIYVSYSVTDKLFIVTATPEDELFIDQTMTKRVTGDCKYNELLNDNIYTHNDIAHDFTKMEYTNRCIWIVHEQLSIWTLKTKWNSSNFRVIEICC